MNPQLRPGKGHLLRGLDRSNYEVGYGKPPAETRFKKGQSGNPRGRPKGSRNKRPRLNEERLKTIILDEAYRLITLNDGDRRISIPIAQAVIRSLTLSAAKGQPRAQRLFTELLSTTEQANKRLHEEWLETAINYKVSWEKELAYREKTGSTGPEPLPHPDDVIIDMNIGDVRIKGPMTKEEKKRWDEFRERKAECDRSIVEIEQLLRDNPDYEYKQSVIEDLEHERKIREIISKVIPD